MFVHSLPRTSVYVMSLASLQETATSTAISQRLHESITNGSFSRFPSFYCLSSVTRSAGMVSGSRNGALNDQRISETVSKYQVTSERVGSSLLIQCSHSRMSRGWVCGYGSGPNEARRYLTSCAESLGWVSLEGCKFMILFKCL